jgi:hypothetical protein
MVQRKSSSVCVKWDNRVLIRDSRFPDAKKVAEVADQVTSGVLSRFAPVARVSISSVVKCPTTRRILPRRAEGTTTQKLGHSLSTRKISSENYTSHLGRERANGGAVMDKGRSSLKKGYIQESGEKIRTKQDSVAMSDS